MAANAAHSFSLSEEAAPDQPVFTVFVSVPDRRHDSEQGAHDGSQTAPEQSHHRSTRMVLQISRDPPRNRTHGLVL